MANCEQLKTTKDELAQAISDALDGIMLRAEEREGCVSGDITPMQVWVIGDDINEIAETLLKVLAQNKPQQIDKEEN